MEDFMGKSSMHVGFTIAMFDHWGVGQNAEPSFPSPLCKRIPLCNPLPKNQHPTETLG